MNQQKKIKLLLLADIQSSHVIKWANSLNENGYDVLLFGLRKNNSDEYNPSIKIESIDTDETIIQKKDGSLSKIFYFKALPKLKSLLRSFNPHILHAHYASSYGFLGYLTYYKPFLVSVWGNDIFDFPKKSFLHKKIIVTVLNSADRVFSTSLYMRDEIKKYITKDIDVIPFGIDLKKFKPSVKKKIYNENDIVMGTIKSLELKYGIDYLLRTFKILKDELPELPLKLLIVGKGTLKKKMERIAEQLSIKDFVNFHGAVPYKDVQHLHNELDISVFLSTSESFGVSVLEASACEKPVVVSNIEGLVEVVIANKTGFLVSPRNPVETAEAIKKLLLDPELRTIMGKAGRKFVQENYSWEKSVNKTIDAYKDFIRE